MKIPYIYTAVRAGSQLFSDGTTAGAAPLFIPNGRGDFDRVLAIPFLAMPCDAKFFTRAVDERILQAQLDALAANRETMRQNVVHLARSLEDARNQNNSLNRDCVDLERRTKSQSETIGSYQRSSVENTAEINTLKAQLQPLQRANAARIELNIRQDDTIRSLQEQLLQAQRNNVDFNPKSLELAGGAVVQPGDEWMSDVADWTEIPQVAARGAWTVEQLRKVYALIPNLRVRRPRSES